VGTVAAGGSITISNDDNIIHGGLVTSGQNSVGFEFAYNVGTGQCSSVNTSTGQIQLWNGSFVTATPYSCFPISLHNTNVFGSGNWGRMSTGTIGSCTNVPLYWNINTATFFTCSNNLGGHNANGYNVEVLGNNPNWANSDVSVGQTAFCANLLTGSYGRFPYTFNQGDVENHFGGQNTNTTDTSPMIGGTQYVNNASQTLPTGCAGCNEVFGLVRSPAYKWIRFFHTFNSGSTLCPKCDFRAFNSIVSGSQTHKFVSFSSDMKLGLGTASCSGGTCPRQDIFIGRLD
jgi:hypothetical protein